MFIKEFTSLSDGIAQLKELSFSVAAAMGDDFK